ncbi:MAG: hypothetical protein DRP56_10840, partial [Planctomycetota bacterium]
YREGYLLVRFANEGTNASADAARAAIVAAAGGGTIEKMYTIVPGLGLVNLPDGTDTMAAQTAFDSTTGVVYAEQDYLWRVQAIPNDSDFGELWAMHNTGQTGGTVDADIDAPQAWDRTTGSNDVIVAVIDTGVDYAHPDLAANMWTNDAELNGDPNVDDDNNGYIDDIYGYDFLNNDGDPMDDNSHGTHCSGTIGGVGDNGQGVAGVCWTVKIMALKFLAASGSGSTSDAISCVQYATQMNATLTSNSWGGGGYSLALRDVIEASGSSGQLFIAAAGNNSFDNDIWPHYPSSYDLDNVISVMSTDDSDVRSSFSNWGLTSVDLAAPGSSIYSTIPGGLYDYKSGTSMACPHVAGAAALVWSVDAALTYAEVRDALLGSVDTLGNLTGLCVTEGRLNVYSALLAVNVTDQMPPSPDPMAWEVQPTAVGLETIYMEAVVAEDAPGVDVQYSFVCVNDPNFDSGWQDEPVYYRGGYAEGTTYQFRVKARDEEENETAYSSDPNTTTASGTDTLPPVPNPAQWKAAPRKIGGSGTNVIVAMEAFAALDEISGGVEYRFEETSGNPGGGFTSVWQDSPVYMASGLSDTAPGYTYSFQVQVRDANDNPTAWSTPLANVNLFPPPQVREVPFPYATIQAAINAASNGDTVIVHPGTYSGTGNVDIDFLGLAITVQSEDPDEVSIVNNTIIDGQSSNRAFDFHSGEGADSIVAGFTITNGRIKNGGGAGSIPGGDGDPGAPSFGGAISCTAGSSPTIRQCIITNCVADGSGGDGGHGDPTVDPKIPGGKGGDANEARGGGIYCDPTSSPLIEYCSITNCSVIANGGNGGDAESPLPDTPTADSVAGDGGDAGADTFGGGIYFGAG